MNDQFKHDFLTKFGFKEVRGSVLRVRSDKKAREIIKFFELDPTDEDLQNGTIFSKKEQHGNHAYCAFVKTKTGLFAGICINESDDRLRRWIWDLKLERDTTPEQIAEKERWKKLNEETRIANEATDKRLFEQSDQQYKELIKTIVCTAIAPTLVNELVDLAVKETSLQRETSPDRRPTFAPPIPFSPEMDSALKRLKLLDPKLEFEPGYGRLWAVWESPERANGKCQGFNLRAGKAQDGVMLVQIRPGSGGWWTGPRWTAPRLFLSHRMYENQIGIQELHYETSKERFLINSELRELGIAEILKFAEAPEEVMLAGARIAGICCRCGRPLTDPTSMALGIGPECIHHLAYDLQMSVSALQSRLLVQEFKQTTLI